MATRRCSTSFKYIGQGGGAMQPRHGASGLLPGGRARNRPGGFPNTPLVTPLLAHITQGRVMATLPAGAARVHRVAYAPGHVMPEHSHRTANVTVVVAGRLDDMTAEGERRCEALCVLVKPSGSAHESAAGPHGTQTIVVEVDRRLEAWLRRSCGLFERCAWSADGRAAHLVLGLWARARGGRVEAGPVEPWLSALAGLVGDGKAHGRTIDGRMGRIASRLGEERVASVAREIGMHPVAMARRFRREMGCSPREWRRRERVRRAADGLATTSRPLVSIACEAGFSDQAHLSREFRRESGLTPRAFRDLTRAV